MGAPKQQANKTGKRRIASAINTADMVRMRLAGDGLQRIGHKYGITVQAVSLRLIEARKAIVREPAEELRQLDSDRLEAALKAIAPKVMKGDLLAIDRWERLVMSHAKLHGLTQLSIQDDPGATLLIIEAMRQMSRAAGLALPEPVIEGESHVIEPELT